MGAGGCPVPRKEVGIPIRLRRQPPDSVTYCYIITHPKLSGLKQWFIISHESIGWLSSARPFFYSSCPESLMGLESFDSLTGTGGHKMAGSCIWGLGVGSQLGLLSVWSLTCQLSSPHFLTWCWECCERREEAASMGDSAHTTLLMPPAIGQSKTSSGSRDGEIDLLFDRGHHKICVIKFNLLPS